MMHYFICRSQNTNNSAAAPAPHKVIVHPELVQFLAENNITDVQAFITAQKQQWMSGKKTLNDDNHNHKIKNKTAKEDSIPAGVNPKEEKSPTPPNTIKKSKK